MCYKYLCHVYIFFQNNKVSAKNKKLKDIMHEIFKCETKIKEAESTSLRKIQAEQTRDQDIKLAQQQKSKLENDFSLTIKEIGSGLYNSQLIVIK